MRGHLLALTPSTRKGYEFQGYYTDDGELVVADTVFYANTTLTAKWKKVADRSSVKVYFDPGAGKVSGSAVNLFVGVHRVGYTTKKSAAKWVYSSKTYCKETGALIK